MLWRYRLFARPCDARTTLSRAYRRAPFHLVSRSSALTRANGKVKHWIGRACQFLAPRQMMSSSAVPTHTSSALHAKLTRQRAASLPEKIDVSAGSAGCSTCCPVKTSMSDFPRKFRIQSNERNRPGDGRLILPPRSVLPANRNLRIYTFCCPMHYEAYRRNELSIITVSNNAPFRAKRLYHNKSR